MKLIQTTPGQLELHESATSSIIAATVFILIGVGVVTSPILFSLPWWASLIGLAVIALGIFIIFTATTRDVLLRSQGENIVRTKRVIGGNAQQVTFNSVEVSTVRLNVTNQSDTSRDSEGNSHTERYRVGDLRITLVNGNEIEVGNEKSSSNGGLSVNGMNMNALHEAPLKDEGEKIAQLFSKQLQISTAGDFNPADIPNIIKTVRESYASNIQNQDAQQLSQTEQVVQSPTAQQQPQSSQNTVPLKDSNNNS